MTPTERQIALRVIENLRDALLFAKTKLGAPIMDLADIREYLTDQISYIRSHEYMPMVQAREPEIGYPK